MLNILMVNPHAFIIQRILDVMVENGIDMIDDKSKNGLTAVQYQRRFGRDNVVKCLINNGATLDQGCVQCIATPHSISRFIADWGDKTVTDEQILYEKEYNDHLNGGTRGCHCL